jgi:membrane dipeptidase
LSKEGYELIKELNRLGMLIDLAHVSHQVMHNVLDVSKSPVIWSHSSAFALCSSPRNVPDDVLVRLRETDGVVMVNFASFFIACDNEDKRGTLSNVADHIEHIAEVAGYEHVGIGADYDGVPQLPVGLEDVSKYPDLIEELKRRGWNRTQVHGVLGSNLLRVWGKAVHTARYPTPANELNVHIPKTCPVPRFRFQQSK